MPRTKETLRQYANITTIVNMQTPWYKLAYTKQKLESGPLQADKRVSSQVQKASQQTVTRESELITKLEGEASPARSLGALSPSHLTVTRAICSSLCSGCCPCPRLSLWFLMSGPGCRISSASLTCTSQLGDFSLDNAQTILESRYN